MAYKGGKKKSFFAEQREGNQNPNFANNLDPFFIRQNVRRIIKDCADNLILPQDYIYFNNTNIINACIAEAAEQMDASGVNMRALHYYYNVALPSGVVAQYVDISKDMALASLEIQKATNRNTIWSMAYQAFMAIQQGYDPEQCMAYVQRISRTAFRDL